MELERQFLEINNQRALEVDQARENDDDANRRFKLERELWDNEKTDLLRNMKGLNRKIEELSEDT